MSGGGPPNASESGCGDGEAALSLAPSASGASPGRTGGLGSAGFLIADGRVKGIGICPRDKIRTPLGPSHGLPRLPTAFLGARLEGIAPPVRPERGTPLEDADGSAKPDSATPRGTRRRLIRPLAMLVDLAAVPGRHS